MKLFFAAVTAAAFLWLAVIVTIVGIVIDHIVAVGLTAALTATVLLVLRTRRHRSARPLAARPPHWAHVRSR